jgi:(p)ppGpp synthase/HD superfamily hydrolase
MPEASTSTPLLTARFQRAFELASQIHATQLRKGTTIPYMAHLMSVAALVLEYGGREDAAIAALLHDAVEDSDDGAQTEARIRAGFGDHVAGIVIGCSDAIAVPGQPKPPWPDRKTRYLDRLTAETDPDVLLVSACDKLHNMRSVITDLHTCGPALWNRFSENNPASQLWYYQSLVASYRGRVPVELFAELDRALDQLRRFVKGADARRPPPAS